MRRRLPPLLILASLAVGCSSQGGTPLMPTTAPPIATGVESTTVSPNPPRPGTLPPEPASTLPIPTSTSDSPSADPEPGSPVAGSAGLGDPYFPSLGNGGYDVAEYRLQLDIDPAANTLRGRATLQAIALETLSSFNLDLVGLTVTEVLVADAPAGFERSGPELVVTPATYLPAGSSFTVEVAYHGSPVTPESPPSEMAAGWVNLDGLVYVTAEPDGARTWFPANDHPSDKARFSFEITVADPAVAVANGTLIETVEDDGRTTFHWLMADPMATYLATVVVGDFRRVEHPGSDGIVIRDYLPPSLAADPPEPFRRVGEMIQFLETRFGPFPFDRYGHIVVPGYPGALETQTMSIFGRPTLGGILETVVVHELAHQWFGDSVTPATWRDIWLNEGFATYAEWLWVEHEEGVEAMLDEIEASHSYLSFADHSLAGDPGIDDLFGQSVYAGGGLTLHALRVEVGDAVFFDILRTWSELHRHGTATTDQFIALAERLSERELGPFFDAWLFQEELPDLPEPHPGS